MQSQATILSKNLDMSRYAPVLFTLPRKYKTQSFRASYSSLHLARLRVLKGRPLYFKNCQKALLGNPINPAKIHVTKLGRSSKFGDNW